MNVIEHIDRWHKAARPNPDGRDFDVQLGCHFEEIVEMMDALRINSADADTARACLAALASKLKTGVARAEIVDRVEVLDALCDQIVTAVGVGHCAGMKVPSALGVVDASNWSKFVNGAPVRDENGKIIKGPGYMQPVLDWFAGSCE